MTTVARALAATAVCLAIASCRTIDLPSAPDRGAPAGSVTHVVAVWLKKPGDRAAREAVIGSAGPLRRIPGVISVRAGEVMPSTRPVVDSSYDVGIVVTLRDAHALAEYLRHPAHLKVVEEVIKPHVERYRVYDFTNAQ